MPFQSWPELEALIGEELGLAGQLHDLLVREGEALSGLQHEGLLELVADKQRLMDSFDTLERRRAELLESSAEAGDAAREVRRLLQDASAPASCKLLFQQLVEEITACAEHNARNAHLNKHGEVQILRLMRVLRGDAPEPDTYAPDRQTGPPGHTIAKA